MEEKYKKDRQTEEDAINVQEILFRYLVYWKWFLASFAVCMVLALIYLRVSMPVYNVSSVIMIKDEKKGGGLPSELSLFEGINVLGNTSTDNEIEVLKSRSLIRDAIKDLSLHISYVEKGTLKKRILYRSSPVLVDASLFNVDDLVYPLQITLEDLETSRISITVEELGGDTKSVSDTYTSFPIILESPYGKILLLRVNDIEESNKISELQITISKPINVAKAYLNNFTIAPVSKTSSVVRLNLKNTSPRRGEDFLNKLIEKYNTNAIDDKNIVVQRTADFIEDRIILIGKELGSIELEMEKYKRKEGLTEIKANSELFLRENTEYERKKVENETQLNLIRFLKEYVNSPHNEELVVPSNIGIADAGLSSQINKYNELLLERNRLLRTTSEKNPVVVNQNLLIASLFENIRTLVNNVESSLLITRENLNRQADKFRQQIGNVPTQERLFVEIDRQRQIQSALFLMLLQKREENALAMAATTNKAKIIDETLADPSPVSPRKMLTLFGAFIFSILIPVGVIYLRGLLKIKFSSKAEIEKEKLTHLPVLGEIPFADSETGTDTPVFVEYFRSLRTNVLFMLDNPDKKVVLVTSSIPGEGKTFISINIAKSFGLLNKKILLIGMDIRNPRLKDFFTFSPKSGLVDYLAGSEKEIENVIQKVPGCPNLDVILAGVTPPNPAELLSKDLLDQAILQLTSIYDYIIIDSAPVSAVIDTLILGRVADMTLYVCRANYTSKKVFEMLNDIADEKKLPNLSVVVNAVKESSQDRYGYGYGYGYGKYGHYGK
jgi:capsular exopolysaccharide synthesis family protein